MTWTVQRKLRESLSSGSEGLVLHPHEVKKLIEEYDLLASKAQAAIQLMDVYHKLYEQADE